MKTPRLMAFGLSLLACCALHAQSVQYVTLWTTNTTSPFMAVPTNALVIPVGIFGNSPLVWGYCPGGTNHLNLNQTCTGLTGIGVQGLSSGFLQSVTFEIITPSVAVVSNYVPADAVVIPASSTGPVQVILESSPDLVNWTAASPGTYSGSNGTNRFFRVRAVTQ